MEVLGFICLCAVICKFVHLVPDIPNPGRDGEQGVDEPNIYGRRDPGRCGGLLFDGVEARCGSSLFSPRELPVGLPG